MRCIHKFKNVIFNYLVVYCVMINNISRKCTFRKTKKVYLLFISLPNIRQHDIDIFIYVCCHLHLYYSYFYFLTPFNQTNSVIIIYSYAARCKNEEEFLHLDDLNESGTLRKNILVNRLVLLNDSDDRQALTVLVMF